MKSILGRLKRPLILVVAYTISLMHGKATNVPEEVRTVVVFQTAKLGDMVCTTPLFRSIKKELPDVNLVVFGAALYRELLAGNHDVDAYVSYTRSFFALRKQLQIYDPDCVLICTQDLYALAASISTRVPLIISGLIRGGVSLSTRTYEYLAKRVQTVTFYFHTYIPRERLKLLEPLDIHEGDTTKYLAYSNVVQEKIKKKLSDEELSPEHRLIGILPSAGNKIKEWPLEKYAKLIETIKETYDVTVVVIGGPNETHYQKKLKELINVNYIEYIGDEALSIDEIKVLIDRLDLLIGGDTGPIYIAEAFGTPTIDIVGPVTEKEQPPIGKYHRVIVPPREKPELFIFNARIYDTAEAQRQAEVTTVDEVMEEVISLNKLLLLPKNQV